MLTENHIKEGLSRAFILAVAHRAGDEQEVPDGERVATLRFVQDGRRQHAVMQLDLDA